MNTSEVQRFDDLARSLRSWDWLAELQRQERSVMWLARKTERSSRTLYRYSDGTTTPDLEWLVDAWLVLKGPFHGR